MSKPFIILFLCLQVFASVRAQTVFSKTYGDDAYQNGSALQLLTDGGMVIAGTTGFDQTDSADIAPCAIVTAYTGGASSPSERAAVSTRSCTPM